jgi:tetratricopeptide (TPR) repeat protein
MSPERPPKVFISYSHDSDEHMERVLALADRLRSDGVDAMIDQYVHDPEDGWQFWTEMQIKAADIVLAVCTETYLKRAERREEPGKGHGAIWEISVAYVLLYNQGMKNRKLVPVVFAETDRAFIPVPWQPYTNYYIAEDKGYLDLYRRITDQPFITMPELGKIESLPTREKAVPSRPPTKDTRARFWNVPHSRNDAFTGREQLLADLRADLLKKGKQALFGLGGVGKTQIAVEYAYRHRDEYTAVLWCFAGTEQSLRGGYAAIAALLDLPEKESQEQAKITEAVKSWLEQNAGWLLVLDNADDPAMVKPFLPQGNTGHLLLTSRAYSFQKIGLVSPREVNVLSPDEAREFLLRRTGKAPTEKSEADALAKEVGYLPLALEQAAAYIAETGASFSSYLAAYRKQGVRLLENQGPVMGNDEKEQQKRTVATAWALNFADVEKASPASAELLRLSAFLAPEAIPLELLEKGAAKLPEHLAAKLAELADNPLILDELLSSLLRFSLIRRDDEKRTYSIHPLVQEVVREGLSEEEQKAWAERTVRTVNAAFPDPTKFKIWPLCDRLLPHALACAGLIEFWDMEFAEATLLLNQTGYYLHQRAEYAQAEPLYQRALAIREKALGPEHPYTASSLNNLALLLHDQGKVEEAEPLYRRALAIDERALGADHPDTAIDLNNLAGLYRDQGRNQEAEPLLRRALAIREKALGAEHPDTASSLNNLAGFFYSEKKFMDAEPLFRRALEIREKALGPEHPDTAQSLNNLAEICRVQDKYAEAEPLYRRALAILEKVLGPDHPLTATSLNNIAELYRIQSRYQEAEPLFRRALAIDEKVLGVHHPDTASDLNNLALLLEAQGKPTEAEPLFRGALAIWEKALGQEHPTTVLVRNNLIQFYRNQRRNAEADALAKGAQQKAE